MPEGYSVGVREDGRVEDKKKNHWKAGIIILFIVAVIIGGAIGLALHFSKEKPKPAPFDTSVSMTKFFGTQDALDVTWAHAVNSQAKLRSALDGDVHMLEADILLRWNGLANQTDEPVMAHPPAVTSDITLAEWLDETIKHPNKGIKLDFKYIEVVEPSLKLVKERRDQLKQPVLLNADILPGPNANLATRSPVNATRFLQYADEYYPDATLSLGWIIAAGTEQMYTREMVQEMYELVKDRKQPVTLAVHAGLAVLSWQHLRWFLDQDQSRFTLTLWLSSDWDRITADNLMIVRNNYNESFLYYDLSAGPQMDRFRHLVVTGGNPLNHFQVGWNTLNLTWARNLDSEAALNQALSGDSMMLCGNVRFRDGMPSMGSSSNFTLENWLMNVVKKSSRGIKLTLHENNVVESGLKVLQDMPSLNVTFRQPVWLQADVMTTNDGYLPSITPTDFADMVKRYANFTTLVLGWVSEDPSSEVIDDTMVTEMLAYVTNNFQQPVIFRIHAPMAASSWQHVTRLIQTPQLGYRALMIWASESDLVDPDDLVNIYKQTSPGNVFFDLPESMQEKLINRL